MDLKAALKDKDSTTYQIFDLIRFIVICLAIVIPVRIFIAQPFIVNGASMEPTIESGEYFIVDRISYRIKDPQRGDVVVLRPPTDLTTFYIKRVIGLPGETVMFDGDKVIIINEEHPDGMTLDEPYISRSLITTNPSLELGENEFFVMGDNRPNSRDSRFFGAVTDEHIVGRAWARLLPLKNIAFRPGDHRGDYESDAELTDQEDETT